MYFVPYEVRRATGVLRCRYAYGERWASVICSRTTDKSKGSIPDGSTYVRGTNSGSTAIQASKTSERMEYGTYLLAACLYEMAKVTQPSYAVVGDLYVHLRKQGTNLSLGVWGLGSGLWVPGAGPEGGSSKGKGAWRSHIEDRVALASFEIPVRRKRHRAVVNRSTEIARRSPPSTTRCCTRNEMASVEGDDVYCTVRKVVSWELGSVC